MNDEESRNTDKSRLPASKKGRESICQSASIQIRRKSVPRNKKGKAGLYYVRVAQSEVSRECAHVALPAVAAESSQGRATAAAAYAAAKGREVGRTEVIVPRWRLRLNPAKTGLVPLGGGDVAATHGQRRRRGRHVLDDDDLGHVCRWEGRRDD